MLSKILFIFSFTVVFFVFINTSGAQYVINGLISYWTFDEVDIDGDIVKDSMEANYAAIINAVEFADGKINQGSLFQGG
ncbi:hypothetical protein GF312_05260 [Candidatus Poribacteria bacterium]|nr:hypothetical protein [Candidatus Poribacteria bacterium]